MQLDGVDLWRYGRNPKRHLGQPPCLDCFYFDAENGHNPLGYQQTGYKLVYLLEGTKWGSRWLIFVGHQSKIPNRKYLDPP